MLVTIDKETYFDKDYNLRKMPTVLYIRDPRFLIQGISIKIDNNRTEWWTDHFEARLNELPWHEIDLIGHNLYFDGQILHTHFGIVPRQYRDTQSMANLLLPVGVKRSLDSTAEILGLGRKTKGVLEAVKGIRYPDPALLKRLGSYGINDVELAKDVHDTLWPCIPETERYLMHMTTRMGAASKVQLDIPTLERALEAAKKTHKDTVHAGGIDAALLRSNDQFARLLESLVEDPIPTKLNAKGQRIPAFSKSDAEWIRFELDHPELAPLLEARKAAMSNIMVKRPELFLKVAHAHPGTLPMAYRYAGAHTFRWTGSDTLNVQNLPSLRKSELRKALVAPEGYVIHVADSSQIELRTQLWFSGQTDLLERLANGEDLYAINASEIFGRPITKENPIERGVGKATELGPQYGLGWRRYRAFMAGGPLGIDPIFLSEVEAMHNIYTYRATHPATVAMWGRLDDILPSMLDPDCNFRLGPITFVHEGILLPNGTSLDYSGLRATEEGGWAYGVGKAMKFIWGGSLLENIIQALARIVVADQAVEIEQTLGLEVIGWTHDENLILGPEADAETNQAKIMAIMTKSPSWAPDLPLDAEGGFDRSYSK